MAIGFFEKLLQREKANLNKLRTKKNSIFLKQIIYDTNNNNT